MFISANEASNMTWEARHVTNYGIFCREVNNEIQLAAKRGYSEVTISSLLISDLTKEERAIIKTQLKLAGYSVNWKCMGEDVDRLHIMWEVVE